MMSLWANARAGAGIRQRTVTAAAGITLFELTVASVIGMVIIYQLAHFSSVPGHMARQIGQSSGGQTTSLLAINHIVDRLQRADRIVLRGTGTTTNPSGPAKLLFRYPVNVPASPTVVTSAFFDNAANYRWAQYAYKASSNAIRFYPNLAAGCGTFTDLEDLSALTFEPDDGGPTPPGGEPGLTDNNLLRISLESSETNMRYHGQVTLRPVAYTNLTSNCPVGGPCDSGVGLDVNNVTGGVPAVCP